MKIIAWALLSLIAMCLLIALTGCTFTISSDGSKSGSIDGAALIQILAEK